MFFILGLQLYGRENDSFLTIKVLPLRWKVYVNHNVSEKQRSCGRCGFATADTPFHCFLLCFVLKQKTRWSVLRTGASHSLPEKVTAGWAGRNQCLSFVYPEICWIGDALTPDMPPFNYVNKCKYVLRLRRITLSESHTRYEKKLHRMWN